MTLGLSAKSPKKSGGSQALPYQNSIIAILFITFSRFSAISFWNATNFILILFSHSGSPRVLTNNYGNYSVRLWINHKMLWIVACFILACTIQPFELMQSSLISCSQYGQQMRHHLEIRCKIEVSSLKLVFEVCKRDKFLILLQ